MAAIVGIDDTDSRTRGMCTTYLAPLLAARLRERGATAAETLLVRLAPGVAYKTRGNAAVAVHTDASPADAFACARTLVETHAVVADEQTQPGIVVAPHDASQIPETVARFARQAMHRECSLDRAIDLIEATSYRSVGWGGGRGRLGALAAIGADRALSEWTYERLCYRPEARWGTERVVDRDSIFAVADEYYPSIWDTVDRVEETAVCVPRTPGPVLFGIRGEDATVVRSAAGAIDHEPLDRAWTFRTNQGTDVHLSDDPVDTLVTDRAYCLDGTVDEPPETRAGGHVFLTITAANTPDPSPLASGGTLQCVAFEPTKRFRDRVRALRSGDRVTVIGEVADGTLKLEKFAVRRLVEQELVVPDCPDCGRSMESAGASQGYRCRDCSTTAPGLVTRPLDRSLDVGWYEVPPCARRHVAKPLVRGGFDAPVHPER